MQEQQGHFYACLLTQYLLHVMCQKTIFWDVEKPLSLTSVLARAKKAQPLLLVLKTEGYVYSRKNRTVNHNEFYK